MQGIPLLLRQQLRSSIGASVTRRTASTSASAGRPPPPSLSKPKAPRPLIPVNKGLRELSACNRCRLRAQIRFYSSVREGQSKDGSVRGKDTKSGTTGSETEGLDAGKTQAPEPERIQETSGIEGMGDGGGRNERQEGLPSQEEGRRSNFSKQFSSLMDNLQSNVFIAGQRLNDLTGYSAIEALKRDIQAQETRARETRAHVRDAKEAYSAAINRRSTSQREVNELLQRKHAWTPTDLERFTSLYRSDHANERTETEAQEALGAAERDAEEAAAKLSKSILARYHEEQIWSDKIRRMSTWGTWGLMGVNVLLFLIFQVAVEPWRRKRLVKGFEEKVMEAIERENGVLNNNNNAQAQPAGSDVAETAASAPSAAVSAASATLSEADSSTETTTDTTTTPSSQADLPEHTTTPSTTPTHDPDLLLNNNNAPSPQPDLAPLSFDSWKQLAQDLFSDRRSVVSQRDITTVALEGAAAGAAIMGLLVALFRPR